MATLVQRLFGGEPGPLPPHDRQRDLVLYKYDSCPFCVRVMYAIDRLGLKVEYQDTRRDRRARAALMTKTGRTTVPCLFIDGEPLFESRDIVAWLERYASGGAIA